jgi:pyruvate,water dikinase
MFSSEHMPNAISPLEFELGTKGFLEGFGWGMVPRQVNYFIYFAFQGGSNPQPPAATPDSVREAGRRWREEVLPEVLTHIERYRTPDFESMTNEQLAAEIEQVPGVRFRSGQLHTMAIQPHWLGMGLLINTYKELTGGDDLAALRLIQGYGNKSFEAGERLWRVARLAADIPAVRERLLALEPETALECLAALRENAAAAPVVQAFDAYLDDFGWRSGGGFGTRPWVEDPTVPLTLLRSYLLTDGYNPNDEQRRLVDEREAALRETMAGLDDEGRARLQDAVDAACAVAPLLEDHNFYIDQRLANMPRRLVLAAGRRLASGGRLAKPADVFFLHVAELCAALRGEAEGLSPLAGQRKEEFSHWRTVTPPPYVGAAPPEGATRQREATAPAERAGEVRGLGVSAGVVRGPARVVSSLNEASRLRPGDVLVTSVTQPAWTPLFGIAGAVVTEVGGMLSHTAVAAREYRLPAVVAVPNATRRLRDGQLVEVDGSAGTVRVLS